MMEQSAGPAETPGSPQSGVSASTDDPARSAESSLYATSGLTDVTKELAVS